MTAEDFFDSTYYTYNYQLLNTKLILLPPPAHLLLIDINRLWVRYDAFLWIEVERKEEERRGEDLSRAEQCFDSALRCAQMRSGVHRCAQVCPGVPRCAQACRGMPKCA